MNEGNGSADNREVVTVLMNVVVRCFEGRNTRAPTELDTVEGDDRSFGSTQRDFACVLFEAPQCGPIKLAVVDPSTFLPARH